MQLPRKRTVKPPNATAACAGPTGWLRRSLPWSKLHRPLRHQPHTPSAWRHRCQLEMAHITSWIHHLLMMMRWLVVTTARTNCGDVHCELV